MLIGSRMAKRSDLQDIRQEVYIRVYEAAGRARLARDLLLRRTEFHGRSSAARARRPYEARGDWSAETS